MSRVDWTDDMDAALEIIFRAGIGERYAAERIGVGRMAVRLRRRELGLPVGTRGPKSKAGRNSRILYLAKRCTPAQIAERLGMTRDAVSQVLRRARNRSRP